MVESSEQSGHVGEAGEYNHEMKNLVTTANDIKGVGAPLLRNLSNMSPVPSVEYGRLTLAA